MIEQITQTQFPPIIDDYCTGKLIALNRRKSILQWMVVWSIFMSLYIEATVLFCVNIYSFFVLKERFSINWKLAVFCGISAMISFISILWEGYPFYKFFQQLLLLSFFLMFEWNFFFNNRYFIDELFQKIVVVCIILSYAGILQAIIYHFSGINIFSFMQQGASVRYGKRISSFTMMEPGSLGNLLLVAYCYFLFQFKMKEECLKKIILLIAIFLTRGAVAILLVCFFSCLRLFYDWKKKKFYTVRLAVVSIFLIGFFSVFFSHVKNNTWDQKLERPLYMLHDIFNLWDDFSIENIESQNPSVYASMKGVWIALHSPNRLFGTGLGTHDINHDRVYLPVAMKHELAELNREDAYSIVIRIFSEFGCIGIICVFLYILNCFHQKSAISISIYSMLLALLIRGGHYVIFGTAFFVFLYYFYHLFYMYNNHRINCMEE